MTEQTRTITIPPLPLNISAPWQERGTLPPGALSTFNLFVPNLGRGTAFIFGYTSSGTALLATARHVILSEEGETFTPQQLRLDQPLTGHTGQIVGVYPSPHFHEDLAILEVAGLPQGVNQLPAFSLRPSATALQQSVTNFGYFRNYNLDNLSQQRACVGEQPRYCIQPFYNLPNLPTSETPALLTGQSATATTFMNVPINPGRNFRLTSHNALPRHVGWAIGTQ